MATYNLQLIEDWENLEEVISQYRFREMLFRGQSDSTWKLETSLYRLFKDISKIFTHANAKRRFVRNLHEKNIISQFQMHAHLYLNSLPESNDLLEWLSIMQHHGTPTRLMDVTTSPYIALHFALETGNADAAIYIIDHKLLIKENIQYYGKDYQNKIFENLRGEDAFLTPYEPKYSNDRLKAQQGLFLVPSNIYETFDTIFQKYECFNTAIRKIIIPARLRLEGIRRLRKMNITSDTLFPGIDGFCKSLGFLAIEKYSQLKRIR
ncbi:MAG: FRG domain-containing protein [Bacteroidales bacterium]|nr:FRG domain-containing protein [Bacteroidales bacterium]